MTNMLPSKEKFDAYQKIGLVERREHPSLPLYIYTYSILTNYERLWNRVTQQARGIVFDDKGECIVRCIPKFFNEDEPHALCEIPKGVEPTIYNKLDGSLIQVVNHPLYGLVVTSKGSFVSDHAKWAKQIITEMCDKEEYGWFEEDKTYIFELIHPENRIVLDYGDTKTLYLLAVINIKTGLEFDIHSDRFEKFNRVEIITNLSEHMENMVEGVVVKTGEHRYKLKTGEYLRLHRIVTDFTEKRIWEALSEGQELELNNMPEEFDKWYKETTAKLYTKYSLIKNEILKEFNEAKDLSDKELGLSDGFKHKGFIYLLRHDKDIDKPLWKLVKPKQETTND